MLKINQSFHIGLPHVHSGASQLAFSPIRDEKDELIQAINADSHADEWQLDDTDGASLAEFWNGVEEDIAKDPEWITFSED